MSTLIYQGRRVTRNWYSKYVLKMNTDTTITVTEPTSVGKITEKGNEIEVTASSGPEMARAQNELISWCARKIALVRAEADELQAAFKLAVLRKWKSTTLKRHAELAEKRVSYYEKVEAALKAGFVIVPNFPVSLFAIRTGKKSPLKLAHWGKWRHADSYYESRAPGLPMGEGDHKNPDPAVMSQDYSTTPEEKTKGNKIYYWADSFNEVEFPLAMSKPHIMEATSRAMALKIFDEFGILPAAHRYQDPMIVARLVDPRSNKYNRRVVTFILAWHLDTSLL